jgi:transcriptional repressor NrdR
MKCPFCGSLDTQVIDSRVNEAGDAIRRRRRCADCDKRFTTWETAELRPPQIVKTNGTREDFSETKLRESFRRALHKRPVPTELVDAAVDRIRQRLLTRGAREVPALEIGELVMSELKKLDKIAYIRFASVYKSFQDPDDFRDVLQDLERAPTHGVDDLFE